MLKWMATSQNLRITLENFNLQFATHDRPSLRQVCDCDSQLTTRSSTCTLLNLEALTSSPPLSPRKTSCFNLVATLATHCVTLQSHACFLLPPSNQFPHMQHLRTCFPHPLRKTLSVNLIATLVTCCETLQSCTCFLSLPPHQFLSTQCVGTHLTPPPPCNHTFVIARCGRPMGSPFMTTLHSLPWRLMVLLHGTAL
jgi:hypothetical protein